MKNKVLSVRLPSDVIERLENMCKIMKCTKSAYIQRLLEIDFGYSK